MSHWEPFAETIFIVWPVDGYSSIILQCIDLVQSFSTCHHAALLLNRENHQWSQNCGYSIAPVSGPVPQRHSNPSGLTGRPLHLRSSTKPEENAASFSQIPLGVLTDPNWYCSDSAKGMGKNWQTTATIFPSDGYITPSTGKTGGEATL